MRPGGEGLAFGVVGVVEPEGWRMDKWRNCRDMACMVDNGQLLIRSSGAGGFPGRTGYLQTSYKQLDCAGLVCVKCGALVRTKSCPFFPLAVLWQASDGTMDVSQACARSGMVSKLLDGGVVKEQYG